MSFEVLFSLLVFVVVSTITPGPNNLLLAASGIHFGFRATLPHVLGIHCGVYLVVVLCALGLGQLLLADPRAILLLKIFGSVYLVYLAWGVMGIRLDDAEGKWQANPMSVGQATLFQFSNPKAWFMATTGLNIALGTQQSMPFAVVALCLGFATLGLVCNLLWVGLGNSARALFAREFYRRLINGVLSTLTLVTVVLIWLA